MKILSFFAIAAGALLTLTAAAPRTVIAPEFESGTIRFRIAAVHLSDTATRVDADIYQLPKYWVKADSNISLVSRITDNEYPVRKIESIPVGEKVFAGDSAHIRATFVFDRLAPSDTVFDFVEHDGSWNVSGIDINYKPHGIRTNISGTINGRSSASWLLLLPYRKDFRTHKSVLIPVDNGKFSYDLYTTDTVPYELIAGIELLNGSWTNHYFFAEGDSVKVDLSDTDKPFYFSTSGGKNTTNLMNAYSQRYKLWDESGISEKRHRLDSLNLFYSPEVYSIFDRFSSKSLTDQQRDSLRTRLDELRDADAYYTPEGKELNTQAAAISRIIQDNRLAFIENDGTLTGLTFIYDDLVGHDEKLDEELEIFKRVYLPRYPNNPLSVELQQHLSNEKAEIGAHYPDFTAPDLNGNVHRLSDLIGGKFAVIDLWASWCGPCRRTSIDLIPVYEKWKDKGFTVVGVARENGNTEAMEASIKADGYPWLNLVELNDAGNIWNRYRIGNAGGEIFLVSPNGIIIAKGHDASEVDALLTKLLGE